MATKAKQKKPPVSPIKTSVKPATKPAGKGGTPVPDGIPFSKENQPSSESKKAGWARRAALKDLLKIVTTKKFDGDDNDYKKQTAKYFGIPENEVTILMVMEFRQIHKAITGADTSAFNAVMDRAYGRVKQAGEDPQHLVITIKGK